MWGTLSRCEARSVYYMCVEVFTVIVGQRTFVDGYMIYYVIHADIRFLSVWTHLILTLSVHGRRKRSTQRCCKLLKSPTWQMQSSGSSSGGTWVVFASKTARGSCERWWDLTQRFKINGVVCLRQRFCLCWGWQHRLCKSYLLRLKKDIASEDSLSYIARNLNPKLTTPLPDPHAPALLPNLAEQRGKAPWFLVAHSGFFGCFVFAFVCFALFLPVDDSSIKQAVDSL